MRRSLKELFACGTRPEQVRHEVIRAQENERYDMLKFSYHEVLDATKHQDDKVGRLLGAVAFLTGGALVFANRDVLQVDVLISDRSYPLGAVSLAAFISLDLIAVAAYLMAMSAPLSLPGKREDSDSHLFFRKIVQYGDDRWSNMWPAGKAAETQAAIEDELVKEIYNIAKRADRKYSRTTIATRLFLGALVLLSPTVVIGLASAGVESGQTSLPWDATIRWCTAVALVGTVGALLIPLAFNVPDKIRPWAARLSLVIYPVLLGSLVVADSSGSFLDGGAWAIVGFGALAALLAALTYTQNWRRSLLSSIAVVAVSAAGFVAWCLDAEDGQLFVALAGGVFVVVPNIVDELITRRPK